MKKIDQNELKEEINELYNFNLYDSDEFLLSKYKDISEIFKYEKIILDYNIIDFTSKIFI